MKTSQTLATNLSRAVTALSGLALLILAVYLPRITRFYMHVKPDAGASFPVVLVILYGILLMGACALVSLWILLTLVRAGNVFTQPSVACLRVLSLACVFAGILFAVLGIWYYFSLAIAAAALFLGLILHVLKNCLQEAVYIKQENDFTV